MGNTGKSESGYSGGDVLVLSDEMILRLKSNAGRTYPEECCGLLFGVVTDDGIILVQEEVSIENRDGRKKVHFQIEPMEIYRNEKEQKEKGLDILGFYHSHPDLPAIPSDEDIKEMIPGPLYLIMSVYENKPVRLRAWRRDRDTGLIREMRVLRNG